MKFLNPCSICKTFYRDLLNDSYGIGNVHLTFRDALAFYVSQNQDLIKEPKHFVLSPFKTVKTIDVRKQRLMGYELLTY